MNELLMFILFVFAAIGMGHILVDGTIMLPFKDWLGDKEKKLFDFQSPQLWWKWGADKLIALLSCYQCSGWHAGFCIAIMMGLSSFRPLHWLIYFVYAFAGSFLCPVGALLIQFVNACTMRMERKE